MPVTGIAGLVDQAEIVRKRRHKRRLYTWVAFMLLGTMLGTMWALGWATINVNQNVASAEGDPILGTGGGGTTGLYASAIDTAGLDDITIAWKGMWGSIASDETLFKVTTPSSGTYFVDIYNLSANSEITNDWSALQLEFRIFEVTASGVTTDDTCDASTDFASNDGAASDSTETTDTFTTTAYPNGRAREILTVDAEDAFISFSGLAASKVYCIGVSDATPLANNQFGSFLRRPNSLTPTSPRFAAILNRSS